MRKPFLWLWGAWLLVGTAFEVWGVWFHMQGDDTLSEFTVWAFRASTTIGWFALMLLMGFLAAWFPGHVRHLAQMKAAHHHPSLVGLPARPHPVLLSIACTLSNTAGRRHADWCPAHAHHPA